MKAYAFALLLLAMPVGATVYDFHGTCAVQCSGDVYAEFLLADNYVPGTQIDCGYPLLCPLERMRYIDNTTILDYDFTKRTPAGLLMDPRGFIQFPEVSGFGRASFGLFGDIKDDFPFRADMLGNWQMSTPISDRTQILSGGTSGTFELAAHEFIPEPGTWLLLGAGLLALPLRRRKWTRIEQTSPPGPTCCW